MIIRDRLGIRNSSQSLKRMEKIVRFNDDLDTCSEALETVFKLVQIAAADHPDLETDVTKAEMVIQAGRNILSDMRKNVESLA